MFKTMKKENLMANIRAIYAWVYIAFIGIMEATPVCVWTEGASWPSMIYNALAIGGAILLAVDFFSRRVMFKAKYCGVLLLFLIATVLSIVVNMRYGIADNVKTLVWSCIQILLLAAVDTDLPREENEKRFRYSMHGLSILWGIGVLVSLGMFSVFHQGVYYLEGYTKVTYEGFCESRLYGVFLDPNYAAMFAFVVMAFSAAMLFRKTPVWEKILYSFSLFINFIYLILSGSRTVELSLYLCVVLLGLWLAWNWLRGKARVLLRLLAALLVSVVCVGAVYGLFNGGKKALSYIPALYRESMEEQGKDPIHKPNKKPTDEGGKNHLSGINMERPDVVQNDDVSNNRIDIWTDYIKALPTTSFFGTSPRNTLAFMEDHFDDLYVLEARYGPHNAFLILFVCTGYIGGALAMAYLILVVVEILGYLLRKRKQMDETYYQVLFYTLAMVMFAICAMSYAIIFFNNMLITLMFWFLLGHTRALIRYAEPERFEKQPLPYRLTEAIKTKVFKKRGEE